MQILHIFTKGANSGNALNNVRVKYMWLSASLMWSGVSDAGAGVPVSSGPESRGVREPAALRAGPLGRSWAGFWRRVPLTGVRLRLQTVCGSQDRRERDAAAVTSRELLQENNTWPHTNRIVSQQSHGFWDWQPSACSRFSLRLVHIEIDASIQKYTLGKTSLIYKHWASVVHAWPKARVYYLKNEILESK